MKRPLRFVKTVDLLKAYQNQCLIYESLKETLRNLSDDSDIQLKIKTEKELLKKQVDRLKIMNEFIKRYSPVSAQNMNCKLKGLSKSVNDWLERVEKEDKWEHSFRLESISRSNGLDVVDQWILSIFIAICDTIKTAKLPFLLQKNEYLELKLKQLDERYLELYHGAWLSLESQNPDNCRQCAASLRQLLVQIIDKAEGKERDDKIKNLIKFEDSKFENTAFLFVKSTLSLLNKAVHKTLDGTQMAHAFVLTEDSLLILTQSI